MKSKRIMIGCMSLVICLLALTACSVAGTGSQNDDRSTADEKYHTLYYKDITKREQCILLDRHFVEDLAVRFYESGVVVIRIAHLGKFKILTEGGLCAPLKKPSVAALGS